MPLAHTADVESIFVTGTLKLRTMDWIGIFTVQSFHHVPLLVRGCKLKGNTITTFLLIAIKW